MIDPNPTFTAGPFDFTVHSWYTARPVPLLDVTLSARIEGGGASIDAGTMSGVLDTRYLGATPEALCQYLASYGVVCDACPDTGDVSCLPFEVQELGGQRFGGGLLTPRTQEEIDADPTCP